MEAKSDDAVAAKVNEVVTCVLGLGESDCKPESRLVQDLDMDDLNLVELTMGLEDGFEMGIPDEDADKWKTVADVIAYVREKTPAGAK